MCINTLHKGDSDNDNNNNNNNNTKVISSFVLSTLRHSVWCGLLNDTAVETLQVVQNVYVWQYNKAD
jgi:hypothetical protein